MIGSRNPDPSSIDTPSPRMSAEIVAQALPAMIAFWNPDLICEFANGAYGEWFGRSPDEMLGCHIRDLMGERLFARNEPYIRGALAGFEQRFERTLTKADGSIGHTLASYIPQRDATGAVLGFVAQVVDVTPLEETRRALALAGLVFDSMVEAVIIGALDGTILSVNPAFTRITGYKAAESVGRTTHFLGLDLNDESFRNAVEAAVVRDGFWRGDVWSRRKNGQHFLAEQTTSFGRGQDGTSTHFVSLLHDVTEARQALDQLHRQAHYDCLTALPNRAMLFSRLETLTACNPAAEFALIFLDLDRFKPVNDQHGHDCGDQVLLAVARRLATHVRETDFVARLAGDEFVILVEGHDCSHKAFELGRRLEQLVANPINLGSAELTVGVSIGIAHHPADGRTPAALLAQADHRMYRVKDAKRRGSASDPGRAALVLGGDQTSP